MSNPLSLMDQLILAMLGDIHTRLEKVMSDQDTLNQFVSDLKAALALVGQRITDLEAAHPAIDWTEAKAALATAQSLEPPAAPAAAPADGSAPAAPTA